MDPKFMRAAIRLSRDKMRENRGGPFGAVVVRQGRIVARGWNEVTSANDPTAHAEIVAIRKACRKLGTFRLDECEIYTSCEPCPMCLAAIYWARIARIYYAGGREDAAHAGFNDERLYAEVCRPRGVREVPMEQALRSEAIAVFEEWVAKQDRVPY